MLAEAVKAFLLSREAAGHTPATLQTYAYNLGHFVREVGVQGPYQVTSEIVQRHITGLRARMQPISVHQAFRVLRTFCRWCVRTGRLAADPDVIVLLSHQPPPFADNG